MPNHSFSTKSSVKDTVAFAVENNLPDELLKKVFADSIECIPAQILRQSLFTAIEKMSETQLESVNESIIQAYSKPKAEQPAETAVVFTDFDGVLIPIGTDGFQKKQMELLKEICSSAKNCKIVLSTYHRQNWDPDRPGYINEAFAQYGLEVFSKTGSRDSREREIDEWLNLRSAALNITSFVILDDEGWHFVSEEIRQHLVQTHPLKGLTAEDAARAVKILKNEF